MLTTLGVLFIAGGVARVIAPATADQREPESVSVSGLVESVDTTRRDASAPMDCNNELASLLASDASERHAVEEALRIDRLELEAREQQLANRKKELEELRDLLRKQWTQLQEQAEEDIRHLAAMYGAMKSDEAASIFNQMDPAFAAGFLREMPGDAAGPILAEMNPDKAYRISIEIASRGAEVRRAGRN